MAAAGTEWRRGGVLFRLSLAERLLIIYLNTAGLPTLPVTPKLHDNLLQSRAHPVPRDSPGRGARHPEALGCRGSGDCH